MYKKIILITSGEPGGIGPDICLDLVMHNFNTNYLIIVLADFVLLQQRAKLLNKVVDLVKINPLNEIDFTKIKYSASIDRQINKNVLYIYDIICPNLDIVGQLDTANSAYVLKLLDTAITLCKQKISNIIVTAPISKEIINQIGIPFSGHTEYLAKNFGLTKVIMMLTNEHLSVALLTTHIALKEVSSYVTADNLNQTLKIIIHSLKSQYGIKDPKIAVCGLNPHAGEGGYIGDEEITIINPTINHWQEKGYNVSGPYPADTIFNQAANFDVILAMYHDQGLPVLKYSGFETGINVTLGLPIIRTSVDHGVALKLAGTGLASSKSLICAINYAIDRDIKTIS